jgi:hypothetical protein
MIPDFPKFSLLTNEPTMTNDKTTSGVKPTHAKPNLYAYYFLKLKEIARECGYNLVVHGSMNRDLDLIAIPWTDDPKPEIDLINALSYYLTGQEATVPAEFLFTRQPGGRHNYVISLNRGGYRRDQHGDIIDPIVFIEDPEYYIDISVTPIAP